MFGGGKTDNLAMEGPKPLGQKPEALATHEFGRPVPYFAGVGQMSGTFISEPWGVRSVPVKRKVGKKSQVVGYNYYASFAMVFCIGPVDRITQVWMNDELFWEGSVTRGSTDYADITVTNFGTMRLYWGTETQTHDTDLNASGQSHPAYRGQCYAVFKDWLLGMNKTNCPNVELRIQRTPQIVWITAAQNIEDDANPIAVLAELLQSPRYGQGIDPSRLDTAMMNSAAARLELEGIGISPYINGSSKAPQVIAKLLDHIDGFPVQQPSGLFGIGLIRTPTGIPVALNESTISEPPALSSHLWWETTNSVSVRYVNRDRGFEADSVSYRDRASFAITGQTKDQQVTRDWFTRQDLAWRAAAALCRQASLPFIEGTVKVFRSVGKDLLPGSVVTITYANSNLSGVMMRVTSVASDGPDSPTVTLKVRDERGYLNEDFYVPADVIFGDPVEYSAGALYSGTVQELPFGWTGDDSMQFVMQPVRNDVVANGFTAWWERYPSSFVDVGDGTVFWQMGTVNADLPSFEGPVPTRELDLTLAGADKVLEDQTETEAVAAPWVWLFIGDEILIPFDPVLVSAGRYRVKVLRGKYATPMQDITVGSAVRVLSTYGDPPVVQKFTTPVTASQKWKLQPAFMANALNIALCPTITVTPRRVAFAPLPPANPSVNSGRINVTFTAGSNFVVNWTVTSEARATAELTDVVSTRADKTIIEITDASGVLKGTVKVSSTTGPTTILNATVVGFLGLETDFRVRLRYERLGVASLTYSEIAVWKT